MIETSEFSAVQTAMNLLLGLYEKGVSERNIASLASYYKALIKSHPTTQLPYFQ